MNKFILPKERIPKPFSQNILDKNGKVVTSVGSCVACTLTKILEVINYLKTGTYIELSKGYMYVRNNYPNKKDSGMVEDYTLPIMLKRGTVPVSACNDYDEFPEIATILNSRSDIGELDKKAEETKIKGWENIGGNNSKQRFENVKKYLYEKQMPLAVAINRWRGEPHSVVAVGYEDDKILWQDHDGTDEIKSLKYTKFIKAYYIDGGIEMVEIKHYTLVEYLEYIKNFKFKRKITRIQLHHTAIPSYGNFNGKNHIALQKGMKNYHVNSCGYADIAQNLTIFPDGTIVSGRDLNTAPAGIKNANTGGICIECLGNFDTGKDEMTKEQKNAIVAVCHTLLDKLNLNASENVTYHCWWSPDGREIGDYVKSASVKTCPGTNFFGGNGLTSYKNNLQPLIENYGKKGETTVLKPITEINDIVWELANAGIITNSQMWMDKCGLDINIYWLCRKMANKLRGTLE